MLIGSWAALAGQVWDRLPVNGCLPNSTSAMPSPCEPGSQDATSASMFASCSGVITCGRPDTTRTTHSRTASHTVSTTAASPGCSSRLFGSRSTPPSSGSKPQRGPPTSPNPSEYGVSPTTTIPTSASPTGAEASSLEVTCACGATWRMPSRIVLPGIRCWPDAPCQLSVQRHAGFDQLDPPAVHDPVVGRGRDGHGQAEVMGYAEAHATDCASARSAVRWGSRRG